MAIAVLDLPVDSTTSLPATGAVSAGSDRIAILTLYFSSGVDAGGAATVTLGGQSMTLTVEADDGAGGDAVVQVWTLNETGISAMSGNVIVVSGQSATASAGSFMTISGADQTAPVTNTAYTVATSGTLSLARAANSWTYAAAVQDYAFALLTLTNPAHVSQWNHTNMAASYGYAADSAGTSDITWSTGTVRDTGIVGINFVDASSVSVTQTDTTPEDGVQQSLTTSGLTGTPTGTLAGKALTLSGTLPNLTYTVDVSAVQNTEGMPRIGETSTVSVTATEGTATTDVVIQPKTGWARVVLAGTLDKSANGLLATIDADSGIVTAVGDILYYNASNNAAITATGVYTSDLTSEGQSTRVIVQQGGSATTTAQSYPVDFYPYGEGASTVGKSRNKKRRERIRTAFMYQSLRNNNGE